MYKHPVDSSSHPGGIQHLWGQEVDRQNKALQWEPVSRTRTRTHHSDPVSDGFSRQVAGELGPDHPAVPVGAGHLAPDHPGPVGFASGRHRVPADTHRAGSVPRGAAGSGPGSGSAHLLLGLVDEGAAFAQVEVDLVAAVAALQLQQRRVLALVPQTALVAGEDGLTPESEGHRSPSSS